MRDTRRAAPPAVWTAIARTRRPALERESPRAADDRRHQQRRQVPQREIQDEQLAGLRSTSPACMLSERQPVRLERTRRARRRSRRQRPTARGASTLFACEQYPEVRENSVKAPFVGPSKLRFVTGFCVFSPGRPPAPSASHRPADAPPVKAATASVSRAWSAGALQARWATAAASSRSSPNSSSASSRASVRPSV